MTIVTFSDMKRHLKQYLQRVQKGETLVVSEKGRPVAEVRPVAVSESRLRPYGLCEGEFYVPDAFDDPLPEEILALFGGQ